MNSKKKTKILFITNMYPYSGYIYYGIHVKEQIDFLNKNNNILSSIYFINAHKNGKIEYIKSIFKIIHKLKISKVDVVHIHYGLSALFLLFFKPTNVKIFLTFHGGDILKEQGNYIQIFISKLIAKKVNRVFILNNEMEKIMQELEVPYEILPCGVDIDFFKNNNNIIEKEDNSRLIVFPGNPERHIKNFSLFSKVIDILRQNCSYEIKFVCIHNMTRNEVRDLLNNADCLLMTSFSEGSPQIIKEAMACNRPIVSTAVGDVEDLLDNVKNCFALKSFNHNDFISPIQNILQLPKEKRKTNGRSKIINMGMDEESISRKLYDIYENTI